MADYPAITTHCQETHTVRQGRMAGSGQPNVSRNGTEWGCLTWRRPGARPAARPGARPAARLAEWTSLIGAGVDLDGDTACL